MSFRTRLNNIQTNEKPSLNTQHRRWTSCTRSSSRSRSSAVLVGVIGGVTAMVLFVRSIVRRIGEVDANARRLGVSEPLLPIPPAQDEVGHLAEELRQTSTLLTQRSTDLVRAHAAAVTPPHAPTSSCPGSATSCGPRSPPSWASAR